MLQLMYMKCIFLLKGIGYTIDMAGPVDPRLKDSLSEVPHALQLDYIINIKKAKCVCILDRIQSERLLPCGFEEEQIRRDNFSSLLHFHTNQKEKASEINARVCENATTNITALVNKAVMKMATGHEYASQEAVRELDKLRGRDDYKELLAVATAEQAYCMSRIGPHLYVQAIDLYENAINECSDQYLWKFGCALTCRRCLGMPKCIENMTPERLKVFCERVIRYLSEITINCKNQLLIAKAFVELGDLYLNLEKPAYPLTQQIVDQVTIEGLSLTAEQCLDKALETVNAASLEDEFVLGRCGKLLRFARQPSQYSHTLKECLELLKKAYVIRPNSFICDQLAKILLKLAEQGFGGSGCGHGRGHGCGRGRGRGRARGRERGHHGCRQSGNHTGDDEMPYRDAYDRNWDTYRGGYIGEPQRAFVANSSLNAQAAAFVPKMQGSSDQQLMSDSATTDLTSEIAELSLHNNHSPRNHPRRGGSPRKLSKLLNSPKCVKKYPSNRCLTEAVRYLQESIAMTKECNHTAIYDLGLTYRRLDQVETAVEQFRKIISDPNASPYSKSTAYEQIGFCLLEMSKGSQYSDVEKLNFREESKMMMTRCIEQTALLVARIPTMGKEDFNSWQALPTLKQLLTNEPNKPESIQEIARMCALVGAHRDSLEFYKQLLQLKPGEPTLLSAVIKQYMCLHDFHNARSCLQLLLCTREGQQMANKEQYLVYQVYLGIAKHLLDSESTPTSKDDIRSCFQSAFTHRHERTSSEDDEGWDVFVLDDPGQTDAEAAAIKSWFGGTCGLSVTRNTDDVLGYEVELTAELNAVKKCKCLVVLLGEATATKRLETLVAISRTCDGFDVIVPVLTCPRTVLPTLKDKRPVELSPDFLTCQPSQQLMNMFLSILKLDYTKFAWLDENN